MVAFPTYSLGTVSVAANSTTVTGDGVIWDGNNARSGDTIYIDGVLNQISDVTDDTHLELINPSADTKSSVSYVVVKDSKLRFVGGQQMVDVSFLIGILNSKGLLWYLPAGYTQPSDVQPPLTAEEGQGILKIDTGALWVMQGGSWVSAGKFQGFNFKGAYDSGTAYSVNDVLTDAGSAYVVTAPTTGHAPPNASYYSLFASRGDQGDKGDAATIAIGTVTGVAYGEPATVTNVGTSGAAVFDFEIPKGQDGSGTGDIVGPSSATDATVAGFDGTTGKLIKQLTATDVRAAAGATTVGAAVLIAADEDVAQSALGGTTIGKALFTATDVTDAQTAFGLSAIATADPGHVPGIATNTNASAGEVGEIITATATTGTLSSGTSTNVTSITLTAGDWDITAGYNAIGSSNPSVTDIWCSINTATPTNVNIAGQSFRIRGLTMTDPVASGALGPLRVSIASSTTYYLNTAVTYTGGSFAVTGVLRARRMR